MIRTTLLAAAIAVGFSAAPAAAKIARVSCGATGAADFSMSVEFRGDSSRRKFNASFESAPGLGFTVGQLVPVKIGGVGVGPMTLTLSPTGDIVGDLTFDSRDKRFPPFPATFPAVVEAGMGVVVATLGCELK